VADHHVGARRHAIALAGDDERVLLTIAINGMDPDGRGDGMAEGPALSRGLGVNFLLTPSLLFTHVLATGARSIQLKLVVLLSVARKPGRSMATE
jgi:hypothetical protein